MSSDELTASELDRQINGLRDRYRRLINESSRARDDRGSLDFAWSAAQPDSSISSAKGLDDVLDTTRRSLLNEVLENPLRKPRQSVFGKNPGQRREMKLQQDTLMKSHKSVPIKLAGETHFARGRLAMCHEDKIRQAKRNFYMFRKGFLEGPDIEDIISGFVNDTNLEDLQHEEMEAVTKIQRATCDVVFVAMFKLFHQVGPEKWDGTTAYQRRLLYRDVHREMPLAIDRLLHPNERKSVDLCTIHANLSDETAKKFRRFCEYKFVRLCEHTMYYRIWKFSNWKEPVYNLYKTLCFDDGVERELGLPMDITQIPGTHMGPREVNHRPRAIYNPAGSHGLSSLR